MSEIIDRLENSPAGKQWKSIGVKHHHGFDVPLFSLHSENSCGIGEFPDLIPMIDWSKKVGFDVIQLLPLNDTSIDNSPYNAISAFALNPLHLGLISLPNIDKHAHLQHWIKELQIVEENIVKYAQVREGKTLFLNEYFRLEKETILNSADYQQFVIQNRWLKGYALFKTLKIINQWFSWETWEESLQNPNEKKIKELEELYNDDILFHMAMQFLSFQQLENVKKHACEKGIFLKGDIPILISRDSADVWLNRSIFIMQFSAGAPPDQYSAEGQNWGFPVYNWHELEKQHYGWWRERLTVVSSLYHIYRIDHIVGFFRIWVIPPGKMGIDGRFFPEDRSRWIPQGKEIMLMQLEATPMLPIGEDLGTIPPEVRQCLRELGICGTKVMRWERNWDTDRNYIKPEDYLPESMTTVSTHDSPTLQLWWEKSPDEAKEYAEAKGWQYTPELTWQHRFDILWESHHTASLFHINLLQEYLPLVPEMSWSDPEEERINVPGVLSDRNWCYRMKPSIEQIVSDEKLPKIIQSLIKDNRQ